MSQPHGMSRKQWAEKWERSASIGPELLPCATAEKNIAALVDSLLCQLFCQHSEPEYTWQADNRRLAEAGIGDEAINWGDIGCVDVHADEGNTFKVYIEEASPKAVGLKRWLAENLLRWGWDCEVETEW